MLIRTESKCPNPLGGGSILTPEILKYIGPLTVDVKNNRFLNSIQSIHVPPLPTERSTLCRLFQVWNSVALSGRIRPITREEQDAEVQYLEEEKKEKMKTLRLAELARQTQQKKQEMKQQMKQMKKRKREALNTKLMKVYQPNDDTKESLRTKGNPTDAIGDSLFRFVSKNKKVMSKIVRQAFPHNKSRLKQSSRMDQTESVKQSPRMDQTY